MVQENADTKKTSHVDIASDADSTVDIQHDTDIVLISDFVHECISYACSIITSDIHIDPFLKHVEIKLRSAGKLEHYKKYKKKYHEEIIGRLKVLSKLRTDVHDRAQDGRFAFDYNSERVDIRVSILPTFYGENAVLRILRPNFNKRLSFESLGLNESQVDIIKSSIAIDQGIIVIAGPTGSGKTTTIYTIISSLVSSGKNIITIEDPVEYIIPHVRQIQISEASDFGFAKALRAILRQDPDIIVLGEIRDQETAKLAFQAALTGHLVITTIHARDSAGVYGRLSDLGVSRDMMHSLVLMISQRIITHKGKRRGVFEVIPVEGKTKVTLFQNTYPEYIRKALKKQGVLLLEDSVNELLIEPEQPDSDSQNTPLDN